MLLVFELLYGFGFKLIFILISLLSHCFLWWLVALLGIGLRPYSEGFCRFYIFENKLQISNSDNMNYNTLFYFIPFHFIIGKYILCFFLLGSTKWLLLLLENCLLFWLMDSGTDSWTKRFMLNICKGRFYFKRH